MSLCWLRQALHRNISLVCIPVHVNFEDGKLIGILLLTDSIYCQYTRFNMQESSTYFQCIKCFVSFFLNCNKLIFNILCFYEILRGTNWGQKFAIQKIKRANIRSIPWCFLGQFFCPSERKTIPFSSYDDIRSTLQI